MIHSDDYPRPAEFFSGVSDRLQVDVDTGSGITERLGMHTSFHVERWDAEQTEWARKRIGFGDWLPPLGPTDGISPDQFARVGVKPYLVTHDENCNLVCIAGMVALLGSIAGTSITNKFSATQGRIGVGTSATAAAYGNTTLTGDTGGASTTSYFKLVSGAPTIQTAASPATLTFVSIFGTAVANFVWAEFGTDNGNADSVSNATTGGIFFNHGVSAQGTKASGQTWTATETLSFGFPSGAGTVT
jgi:hypothetical protein